MSNGHMCKRDLQVFKSVCVGAACISENLDCYLDGNAFKSSGMALYSVISAIIGPKKVADEKPKIHWNSDNVIRFVEKTWLIKFKILDKKFNKFLVEKASISENGVSLTISKTFQSILNRSFK